MEVNLVSLAAIVSCVGFTVGLVAVLATPVPRDGVFGDSARWGLAACLAVYAFVGLSNALEHGGVSSFFDSTYEDYIEVLFSPMLLYFFYAAFARVELRKRERAERFLREELDILGTVVDVCPVAIMVTDGAGMLAFANEPAEHLLGLDMAGVGSVPCAGWAWRALDGSGDDSAPWLTVAATAASMRRVPYRLQDTGGLERGVLVNATPVLGVNGVVTGVVVAFERFEERAAV